MVLRLFVIYLLSDRVLAWQYPKILWDGAEHGRFHKDIDNRGDKIRSTSLLSLVPGFLQRGMKGKKSLAQQHHIRVYSSEMFLTRVSGYFFQVSPSTFQANGPALGCGVGLQLELG